MPIRINLLAEQQAAEEARRRDPVKRALWACGAVIGLAVLWACGAVIGLAVLWSVLLQLRLVSAKAELNRYDAKLQAVEEKSKDARAHWTTTSAIEARLGNLQRYSTNRFFSANLLDALQEVAMDDVRIIQLRSTHAYTTNTAASFKTNVVLSEANSARAWEFWKAHHPAPNVPGLVANQLGLITNKVEALKSAVPLVIKVELSTNDNQISANIEIAKPATAAEQVTVLIKARDYGTPAGRHVDEFSKALANHPYFRQRLLPGEGEGIRLRERAIQPEFDLQDTTSAARPFVPFVIECRYREMQRANE